jgi:hypothetical protein
MLIVYIRNYEEWICILILQKWNPQITCIVKKNYNNYSQNQALDYKIAQVLQDINLKQWKC